MSKQDHPTIPVSFGSLSADIDVLIAPLILGLWKIGVETVYSCQDFRGHISISFKTEFDAAKFIKHLLIHHEPEGSSYACGPSYIFELRCKGFDWPAAFGQLKDYPKVWQWNPNFEMDPPMHMQLMFPPEDLPMVMKCFGT